MHVIKEAIEGISDDRDTAHSLPIGVDDRVFRAHPFQFGYSPLSSLSDLAVHVVALLPLRTGVLSSSRGDSTFEGQRNGY